MENTQINLGNYCPVCFKVKLKCKCYFGKSHNINKLKHNTNIQEVKDLRVQIDGLAQLTKELYKPKENLKNSNNWRVFHPTETEKTVNSLYLAKAWLGKLLSELGNENPYKSGYKTKEDIKPTADTAKAGVDGNYHLGNVMFFKSQDITHIEKVDWLRSEIEKIIENLVILQIENKAFHNIIYQYLSEAKFWLGFELERIKNGL